MMKNKIKDLREQTKLTQRGFAEYLRIPLRTIENWETGKSCPPEYVVDLIEFRIKAEITRFG